MSEKKNKVENFDIDWEEEANAVIEDVKRHVETIEISKLPMTKEKIFFNMTTLERKNFCVELSPQGFRVVGEMFDAEDKRGKYEIFETPYSMLESMSPAYRDSFSEQLVQKLSKLQKERAEEEEREKS